MTTPGLVLPVTRWQRLKHAFGFAWRSVEICPHPAQRARQSDGCGYDPAMDVVCVDCGAFLFLGNPCWRLTEEGKRSEWAANSLKEPAR